MGPQTRKAKIGSAPGVNLENCNQQTEYNKPDAKAAVMATGNDIPLGAPVWMDLVTDDVDRACSFYEQVFGWKSNDTPDEFGGYRYFTKDDKGVGGVMTNDPQWNMPNAWSIHLRTNDVNDTAARAKQFGGSVLMEPMQVETNGSFAIIQDAGGAVIYAWQPGTETGFDILNEVDTPGHFELHTRDYDKTVQFYRDVFDWQPNVASNEPDFRYTTFSSDMKNPRAGIMDASAFLPADVPAHWSVYIQVDNADKTIEVATNLGGKLVMPADDTPYGRLAVLADPTGAIFKLRS